METLRTPFLNLKGGDRIYAFRIFSLSSPKERLFQILTTVVLIVCICSLAVALTLAFRPLYYLDMDLLNIPQNAGLDAETVKRNYDILIDYNLSFTESPLRFPSLPMSKGGEQHFQEVKNVLFFFKIGVLTTFFPAVFGVLFCLKKKLFSPFFFAGLGIIFLPIFLFSLVFMNWKEFFIDFHRLFFDNTLWIFSAETDPIILQLPEEFFLHCALFLLLFVLLFGVFLLAVWFHLEKKRPITLISILKKRNIKYVNKDHLKKV